MVNLTPHNSKPVIKIVYETPVIIISQLALQKMNHIIDLNKKEVGWLGSVIKTGNLINILDVYLFKQQVASTTCELTPEGLTDFAMEILALDNGTELYNSIKLWGHSHVNMGVSPSGQDDSQMDVFKTCGHDWFLRVIGNKSGSLGFTFYDYANNVVVEDAQWGVIAPQFEGLKEQIEEECKSKVSDMVYVYPKAKDNIRQYPNYHGEDNDYDWYGKTSREYWDNLDRKKEQPSLPTTEPTKVGEGGEIKKGKLEVEKLLKRLFRYKMCDKETRGFVSMLQINSRQDIVDTFSDVQLHDISTYLNGNMKIRVIDELLEDIFGERCKLIENCYKTVIDYADALYDEDMLADYMDKREVVQ